VDSRASEDGAAIRRRRECGACGERFTTFERVEELALSVRKTTGAREPFSRAKIERGVAAAAKGRPLSTADLERLAADVEEELRLAGSELVDSRTVGQCVLSRLAVLDQVAYVRFASVYKEFEAAADFGRELDLLAGAGPEHPE
jgi:transcriptional repressor NrdR